MKNWLIWLVLIVVFVGGGFGLSALIGGFGYCISGLIALLFGILIFRTKAEKSNRDQVVYDDNANVISRSRVDEEE